MWGRAKMEVAVTMKLLCWLMVRLHDISLWLGAQRIGLSRNRLSTMCQRTS